MGFYKMKEHRAYSRISSASVLSGRKKSALLMNCVTAFRLYSPTLNTATENAMQEIFLEIVHSAPQQTNSDPKIFKYIKYLKPFNSLLN